MRVGLILPLFSGDPGKVLDFAGRAKELGYDGVFAFDHFFPPGAPSDRPSLEAFSMLAAVGARCPGLTVGTLVTRAALRPAGLIAKMAASIDQLTEGRMVLGVGSGDPIDAPEHRAYGLPYFDKEDRRAHLIETVRAIRALFRGEPWPGGEHVPPIEGPLLPPPVAPGGPPIWIGGAADAVVRMAAQFADAWNGWGFHVPEFARKVALLDEESRGHGRRVEATWAGIVVVGRDEDDAGEMLNRRLGRGGLEADVWAGSAPAFARWLRTLSAAGAAWAVLVPAGPADRIDLIAEEVLPELAAVGT